AGSARASLPDTSSTADANGTFIEESMSDRSEGSTAMSVTASSESLFGASMTSVRHADLCTGVVPRPAGEGRADWLHHSAGAAVDDATCYDHVLAAVVSHARERRPLALVAGEVYDAQHVLDSFGRPTLSEAYC
ncbi:unnamed protein product, partial [Prorocentrum cordatum]